MSNLEKPLGADAEDLTLLRTVTRSRYRELQPAYNQSRQDTLPGADSSTE